MIRNVQQIRPKGDPSAMAYSPQRDLANIYLPMLREVFTGLDEKNWPPFYRELFNQHGITEEQIGQTARVFVDAHRFFVRDRAINSVADAFEQAGMQDMPPAVKHAVFSRLGEVITGGFFVALRDVTIQGQPSSVHADLITMIAAGRDLATRLSGPLLDRSPSEVEQIIAHREEIDRVCEQLTEQVTVTLRQLERLSEMHTELRIDRDRLQTFPGRYKSANFVRRVRYALYAAWRVIWGLDL